MRALSHHADVECPLCTDFRAVLGDLDAIIASPVTHIRFLAYRRILETYWTLHAIVRHDPRSFDLPYAPGEAATLDAEERFTIALLGQIESITNRFAAAVAAEVTPKF